MNFIGIQYEIEETIGLSAEIQLEKLCVFDTGTGPKVICADHLPDEVLLRLEKNKQVVNLRSASTHQLTELGIVTLTWNVQGYNLRKKFVVVRQLMSDFILGTKFINDHVDTILTRRRHMILTEGTEVTIERRDDFK